jgi:hypothetical protein
MLVSTLTWTTFHRSRLRLARNGHSRLAKTQKLDGPAAMALCVCWSNTTYSPGDTAASSLMRIFADSRSFTASNQRKLPSGFFLCQKENPLIPPVLHGVVRQTEGGKKVVKGKDLAWKTGNYS